MYTYKSLQEASDRDGICNTYAVVADCSEPRATRGTDWCSNVILVDPTTELEGSQLVNGVECMLFAVEPALLPNPQCVGSIMRLHRIKAQTFNNRPQLVGKIGKGCSFCLFAGQNQATEPFQASGATYTLEEQDHQVVAALRHFRRRIERPGLTVPESTKRIRDVRPGDVFSCHCKVLAIDKSLDHGVAAFFIWDGTDSMPFPLSADTRQEITSSDEDGSWGAAKRLAIDFEALAASGNTHVPALGTALPVTFSDTQGAPCMPKRGAWIKLQNVSAWVIQGQLQARFTPDSQWSPASYDDDAIAAIRQREQAAHISEWAPSNPREWAAAVSNEMDDVPFTTLRQILSQAGNAAPSRHKCLVRLLEHHPSSVPDFCQPAGSKAGSNSLWRYAVKLRLEDATGEADVLLYGQDGDDFFRTTAQDLQQNQGAAAGIQASMSRLKGQSGRSERGVWMACCFKTFWSERTCPWQSMHVRLLATTISEMH
ncbi:hypothetical protein WJX74_008716 [Apatococcus lobatus]|uniref:Telomeric single stranded DNA binding POT1/Cdc13 domain-containing protein n=1 Tax=Apatococcus lobatus TaxID=904363 RepID=A0AAW1SGF2_9CHLO